MASLLTHVRILMRDLGDVVPRPDQHECCELATSGEVERVHAVMCPGVVERVSH